MQEYEQRGGSVTTRIGEVVNALNEMAGMDLWVLEERLSQKPRVSRGTLTNGCLKEYRIVIGPKLSYRNKKIRIAKPKQVSKVAKKPELKKTETIQVTDGEDIKPVYIPVGSIVRFTKDWLNGASPQGSIKKGQRFRIIRFDQRHFYIRRVNKDGSFAKNSYERKWSRTPIYGLKEFAEIA